MTRVASIDCGTNSIRLLIADVDGTALSDVHRETRIVRLGQDVDRTGTLRPDAIERTRRALADYAAAIRTAQVQRVRMVATSATRDAANRAEFVTMVETELGVEPEVISGAQEADLSFTGAASVLGDDAGPLLVVDIGGGSTELVRGDGSNGSTTLRAVSMDVGCVRLTERHLHDDPPTPDQIAAVQRDVLTALESARQVVPLEPSVRFVGVGGTVLTLAGIVLGRASYDEQGIDGAVINAQQVRDVTSRLVDMTRSERARLPVMVAGREDVIAGGALVLRTLVDEIGVSTVTASAHDILDGIALRLAQ